MEAEFCASRELQFSCESRFYDCAVLGNALLRERRFSGSASAEMQFQGSVLTKMKLCVARALTKRNKQNFELRL